MSGHNKWSTIKHKKGKADAARGRIFSRLVKEISVAARQGGGDPDMNPRLRVAVDTARSQNMPNDNIERAIKRGTGELEGVTYDEMVYEAYGPGGVAIIIEVLTDNKNRSAAEVRHLLTKGGGSLGSKNSVAYLFTRQGQITVDASVHSEDEVLEAGLEAGLEDVELQDDIIVATTEPDGVFEVKKALEAAGIKVDSAEVTKVPSNTVMLEGKEAEKAMKLLESLEEHDDVQALYSNFDMAD
ncbi:MAG TPA: YebC/PmpR family DNA-binding transcriptional regulator [Candidatus Sabulitectum sp.]|nr:YebC/PmpR family DNA-binding transcriptional regulator [Candidatus Sabulitectum sp.]HPF31819.1 YebC/PmpR family DNA-binding transcriptional regulator [Candidatus Sabulitectum sp.]HPJ29466.1 YebC/PmpR family DNA-binding transcriptional regulator [Candidatus Sabulitectum sp.]HPR23005.1 YebC/PmpR family DNA-binding transcriptional regulator [Candidatus Sabulitectum sp.]